MLAPCTSECSALVIDRQLVKMEFLFFSRQVKISSRSSLVSVSPPNCCTIISSSLEAKPNLFHNKIRECDALRFQNKLCLGKLDDGNISYRGRERERCMTKRRKIRDVKDRLENRWEEKRLMLVIDLH